MSDGESIWTWVDKDLKSAGIYKVRHTTFHSNLAF
jgi:hypothetical protein